MKAQYTLDNNDIIKSNVNDVTYHKNTLNIRLFGNVPLCIDHLYKDHDGMGGHWYQSDYAFYDIIFDDDCCSMKFMVHTDDGQELNVSIEIFSGAYKNIKYLLDVFFQ